MGNLLYQITIFLLRCILLLHSSIHALPTLRELSKDCEIKGIEKSKYCGLFPPNCEKDLTCELMTTVEKFELNCPIRDLSDPYIRILCAKRASTFLVTILRLVKPDLDHASRSCSPLTPQAENVHKNESSCVMREFVGVSFTNDPTTSNSSNTPEDNDVFYICTADSLHITTWTKKGVSKIPKWIRDPDKYEDPYQALVLSESGVGIYFENNAKLKASKGEFVCEFVLSVDDFDLEYGGKDLDKGGPVKNPVENHSKLNITLNSPLKVKMIQGFVTRDDKKFKILNVIMEPTPNVNPKDPDPTDFKFQVIDKELKLSELELTRPLRTHESHKRVNSLSDDESHSKYWDPLFEACRLSNETCYLSDDDDECWREEKEECRLLVNFRFTPDFKHLKVRMIVEDWTWGGFAFSLDRNMVDDVGFYCIEKDRSNAIVETQIHLNHAASIGDDPRLHELIQDLKTVMQEREIKRYCEWTMPTKFEVHTGPINESHILKVDLINEEYNVMIGVGNLLQSKMTYHTVREIKPRTFSKKSYLKHANGGNRLIQFITFTNYYIITFVVYFLY